MKKIVIIVPMYDELDHELFDVKIEDKKIVGSFDVLMWKVGKHEVPIMICGIGKTHAAMATMVAHYEFKPDIIINMGSAAGIHEDVKTGDLVVAQTINYYDVDVRAFNYEIGQVPNMPARYELPAALLEWIKKVEAAQARKWFKYGQVISGDTFLNDLTKLQAVQAHFPDAYALDMESAAIAHACHRLNLDCLILRSITDGADDEALNHHAAGLDSTKKQLAKIVKALLNWLE